MSPSWITYFPHQKTSTEKVIVQVLLNCLTYWMDYFKKLFTQRTDQFLSLKNSKSWCALASQLPSHF